MPLSIWRALFIGIAIFHFDTSVALATGDERVAETFLPVTPSSREVLAPRFYPRDDEIRNWSLANDDVLDAPARLVVQPDLDEKRTRFGSGLPLKLARDFKIWAGWLSPPVSGRLFPNEPFLLKYHASLAVWPETLAHRLVLSVHAIQVLSMNQRWLIDQQVNARIVRMQGLRVSAFAATRFEEFAPQPWMYPTVGLKIFGEF